MALLRVLSVLCAHLAWHLLCGTNYTPDYLHFRIQDILAGKCQADFCGLVELREFWISRCPYNNLHQPAEHHLSATRTLAYLGIATVAPAQEIFAMPIASVISPCDIQDE